MQMLGLSDARTPVTGAPDCESVSAETIAASRNPLRSRLARRIVLLVIVAIAVIETTILVPSYLRHRANLFEHFAEQVRTATLTIVGTTSAAVIPEWQEVGRSLMATGLFLGVGFYDHDGALIGAMGEPPSPHRWGISSAGRAPDLHSGGQRFDPAILHQHL
jgi:hypothetical protein